jgi:hypothetical protein
MKAKILQDLSEDFWFRTIDGEHFRQTMHLPFGRNNLRWTFWSTRDKNIWYAEDPFSPDPVESYLTSRDQMIESGWETEAELADKAIPVFHWKHWPAEFRFGTPLINPNPMMMREAEYRYFNAVAGKPTIVMIGVDRILVMDNNGQPTEMGIKVLEEIRDVFPQKTVLRGVYDGSRFHVWDIPFRNGADCLAFCTFSKREPRYSGEFVWKHEELPSGSTADAYWIVDPEVEPESTAYAVRDHRVMSGIYFVRPTPPNLRAGNAPRRRVLR